MSNFQERLNNRKDIQDPKKIKEKELGQLSQQYDQLKTEFDSQLELAHKQSKEYKQIVAAMNDPEIKEAYSAVKAKEGLSYAKETISYPRVSIFHLEPQRHWGAEDYEKQILKLKSTEKMDSEIEKCRNTSEGSIQSSRETSKMSVSVTFGFATRMDEEVRFRILNNWFNSKEEFLDFIADGINRNTPLFSASHHDKDDAMQF